MRSTDLTSHGFGTWTPFTKVGKTALFAALPSKPGVYAIRCCRDFTRSKGVSDILYFGKGTNQNGLKHRIRQYFSPGPTQRTNLRLLALIGDSADYQLASVAMKSSPEAIMLEATLLELYEAEPGELPPENKRR
jgi:excinuclease UvrABC nuclease subunit